MKFEGSYGFLPELKTRSLPALARSYPRHFTFYLAHPIRTVPGFLIDFDLCKSV